MPRTAHQPTKSPSPATPANRNTPPRQPAQSTSPTDVLIVILKGLLIGGSIGFFIVLLLAIYLLTR